MTTQPLIIYNTLTRQKELFKPINAPHVGMYVCGPTVYGDPHLGHARPAITFDVLFRYLKHQGYKVRYVRNITDVGHLEHDADEGDDKIEKKARLEQLEPMEIAQYYTNRYHAAMEALNVLPPSIEPHATGPSLSKSSWCSKFWTTALPMKATVAFILMCINITKPIAMACVRAQPRRRERRITRPRRRRRETQSGRLRPVEEGTARTYHALAKPVE